MNPECFNSVRHSGFYCFYKEFFKKRQSAVHSKTFFTCFDIPEGSLFTIFLSSGDEQQHGEILNSQLLYGTEVLICFYDLDYKMNRNFNKD